MNQTARSTSDRSVFALCVAGLVTMMAGVTLGTPVYALYQRSWGLSATDVTFIYAIYIAPLVIALLFVGGLSDVVGRRPVLVVCFVIAAAGMLTFAIAQDPGWLYSARLLQGLATGGALGALASGAIDHAPARHPTWGDVAASAGPTFGLALGGLAAGLMVESLPLPTVTPFATFGVCFLVLAGWAARLHEHRERIPGDIRRALIPRLGVPRGSRLAFLWLVPATLVIAAEGGQFNALAPTIIGAMLHSDSSALAGAVLAVLHISSAIGALTGGRRSPRLLVLLGMAALAIGIVISVSSLFAETAIGYVIGGAASGYGIGTTFLGCIKGASALAPPGGRASILATVNLVNFVGLTIPLVVAGGAVSLIGVPSTLVAYSTIQLAVIGVAVIGQLIGMPPRSAEEA